MSGTSKVITWAVVVVVIIIGAWWYMSSTSGNTAAPSGTQTQSQQASSGTPGGAAVSPTGTSNAALQQDVSNIDTQLNGLNSDNASADQGLSSQ